MKKSLLLSILAGLCTLAVWAQTNTPSPAPSAPAAPDTNAPAATNAVATNATDIALSTNAQITLADVVAYTNSFGSTNQIEISSDWLRTKPEDKQQLVTYYGHVQVLYPETKMTAGSVQALFPSAGGDPTNMIALTNVVVVGLDKEHHPRMITSDEAVYSFNIVDGVTNQLLTFHGHARYEDLRVIQIGDPITFDLITQGVLVRNPVTIPKFSPKSGTNNLPFNLMK